VISVIMSELDSASDAGAAFARPADDPLRMTAIA